MNQWWCNRVLSVTFTPSLLMSSGQATAANWWLPADVSKHGAQIDFLFNVILWLTLAVLVAVQVTLVVFLVRYRHRDGRKAVYTHGHHKAEVIWAAISAVILVVLGVLSATTWADLRMHPPDDPMEVEVFAQQFNWNFRYPGPDGEFGATRAELIDPENPIGLDPDDKRGADDVVTKNILFIPVNQPILARLRSRDVVHSFFVPHLRIKQDLVPGVTGRIWFEATKTTREMREITGDQDFQFDIVCAELCGMNHFQMRGILIVGTQSEFESFLEEWASEGDEEQEAV